MSQRLKKKDSPTSLAFCSQSVIYLKGTLENVKSIYKSIFLQVFECETNGKDQLNILKLLSSKIKSSMCDVNCEEISLLCDMFIHCESKHPMRRCLASLLQHLDRIDEFKHEIIRDISRKLLDLSLSQNETDIRRNVETINSLMENFLLGDEVVRCNYVKVLIFLEKSLEKSIQSLRSSMNPVCQTKWVQQILVLLKTAISVLQKCDSLPTELLIDSLSTTDTVSCVKKFMLYSFKITTDNLFTLECQTAAAMLSISFITLLPSASRNYALLLICSYIKNECLLSQSVISRSSTVESVLIDCVRDFLLKDLSTTCLLVYLHSILVKVPLDYLCQPTNDFEKGFFDEILIRKLIEVSRSSLSKTELVLAFKTIGIWISEASKEVKKNSVMNSESLLNSISTAVFPHLVLFVDHQIDTIRHSVKVSIRDCLILLRLTNNCKIVDQISSKYFYGNIKSRGAITMLINLTEFVELCDIIHYRPDLPIDILTLLCDVDLATHACELYKVLSDKHLKELDYDVKLWKIFWVKQIHKPLFTGTKEMKAYLVNYLIPGLLQTNPLVVLDLLSSTADAQDLEQIRTLIVFLKALRSMKNLSKENSITFDRLCGHNIKNDDKTWKNLIDLEQMKKCLVCIDEQVRLDTLALICDSVKCTDPVHPNDVTLLQYFLKYNCAIENPSFRQQTVTNLKKICKRMFTHAFQLEKTFDDEAKKHAGVYTNFLSWLTMHCFEKLYQDAPYCQLSMYLEITLLIAKLLAENLSTRLVCSLRFSLPLRERFTKSLIECFEDTYDPNRILVYQIFRLHPVFCTDLTLKELEVIFDDVLLRMNSPQPDISSISAYLVNFLVLQMHSKDLQTLMTTNQSDRLNSVTWECSEGGSCHESSTVGLFLDFLLDIAKHQLSIMKDGLITASQTAPMYGVLYCVRMLFQLQNIDCQKEFVRKNGERFSVYLEQLVCLGVEIIEHVSQYVSNEAPEGYLCDASLAEVFEQLNISCDEGGIEMQAQIARMVLVCCWRSMKEVSLLLGIIVSNFSSPDQQKSVLKKSLLLKMWHVFCDILLRSKHAGAYELASLGFIKLCVVLWSSNDLELQLIPADAVNALVKELVSREAFDNAQVTRRSAGLPFYLQALCTTEPAIKAKGSFKHLMSTLIDLCKQKIHSHDVNKIVIALNILRAFFKDAKLCEDVFPYVSDGVVIGITGFASAVWSIRNSSTLLFSAMMQRIFGVKKFQMTGREFFSRFPSLYSFLMEQAKEMATVKRSCDLHPSLFPVLLLLSHLYPSTMDGNDSLMKLAEFIPHIRSCASCYVYKSRTMAAKALVPLTTYHQAYDIMIEILLNSTVDGNQNEIHGSLLQVRSLLKRYMQVFQDATAMKNLLRHIHYAAQTFLHRAIAYTSKAVYMDILVDLFENKFTEINTVAFEISLKEVLRTTVEKRLSENLGYTIFLRSAASYIAVVFEEDQNYVCQQFHLLNETKSLHPASSMLLVLTKSYCLEVQNQTLQMLIGHVKVSRSIPADHLQQLWQMAFSSDVTTKLYPQVVECFSSVLSVIDGIPSEQLFQLWMKWQDDRILSNISDDVRVSVLKYVKEILKRTFNTKPKETSLYLIWKFIRESSEAEQCVSSRDQVAKLLFVPSKFLTLVSKDVIWEYVRSSINLLKDADADVRNEAATNIHRMMEGEDGQSSFIPLPSFVLEAFFKQIVKERVQHQSIQSAEFLLSTVLDNVSVGDGLHADVSDRDKLLHKFVVYERGKANPYCDQQEIYNLCLQVTESPTEHDRT